jgi:hypothetical protein
LAVVVVYDARIVGAEGVVMRLGSILLAVVLLCALQLGVRADFATPFLEGNAAKVGAVSESYGHILVDQGDEGPNFMILVRSDTMEWFTILAKAEKGVVPAELIGRQVLIKAEVVKAPLQSGRSIGAELKILSVKDGRKKNP